MSQSFMEASHEIVHGRKFCGGSKKKKQKHGSCPWEAYNLNIYDSKYSVTKSDGTGHV